MRAALESGRRTTRSRIDERASALAEPSRDRTSRLQRRLDLPEALDRARPVPFAERVLAVSRLFKEGREDSRRLPGHPQPVDREPLELDGPARSGGPDRREGPRVRGRRVRLRPHPLPGRLDRLGPPDEEGNQEGHPEGACQDRRPGEGFRRTLRAIPVSEKEQHATDEEERGQDRQEDGRDRIGNEDPGPRRRPARGRRLRERLAPGVQIRQIEGERCDEEDGQDQEQRDRPRELSAAGWEHIRAKALGAHNDFPEGPGCADQAKLSCSKKRFRLRSPWNRRATAAATEPRESRTRTSPRMPGPACAGAIIAGPFVDGVWPAEETPPAMSR